MPAGVTVSPSGRIFVSYPRWGDPVIFTVGEIRGGKEMPYPDVETNVADLSKAADRFISVQSVVADSRGRLWVLDTGSIGFAPTFPGGPKLVAIDLQTNSVCKKILFAPDVAFPASYLNDVRFDFSRGSEGMAFITDSGQDSPNGIVVVDLATGKSWRRLNGHPSVRPDPKFVPSFEGRAVWLGDPAFTRSRWAIGANGIAVDPIRKLVYYCPLTSRHLYSVSLDALADPKLSDSRVARTITDLGERSGGSDGLEADREGRLYSGDYEDNAIRVRDAPGKWVTIAQDDRILWPDSLAVVDGYLYFTCTQLPLQKQCHSGKDLRKKPYYLFRIAVDSHRIVQ